MAFELLILGGCIVGLVLLVLLYVALIFNRLITLRNRVDNFWAQIDVQLKRRFDLIPNLVETVKGYATHEKSIMEDVTKFRSQIMTGSVEDRAKANNMLSQTLKSLFAVAENYPDLKANENFKMLQEELEGTENKIAYSRTAYNDAVLDYTNGMQTFPNNIVANLMGFKPKPYFEAPPEEREAVKVKFD